MMLSRNVASFIVLVGLVIFIVFFFLYITTLGEIQTLKQKNVFQEEYLNKLKKELLGNTFLS